MISPTSLDKASREEVSRWSEPCRGGGNGAFDDIRVKVKGISARKMACDVVERRREGDGGEHALVMAHTNELVHSCSGHVLAVWLFPSIAKQYNTRSKR
jgi:hypothetical protein